jgi:sterol desaturase/sphingolipid hydroxylase (fatty acid hydroxylase superfamily)
MSFFIQSLFIAIPIFFILIVTEIFISIKKGIKVNRPVDMISSLSSGITNITKDGLKFGIVLISYSWLVEHFTLYKLEPVWAAVLVAFVVQDITGYWMHRLNHRVNVFWNRHIIHHSSEEFNLSCALRQSISETVHFGAILMIPAAILGVPANIFAVLAPIHLFMQFWYHTRLIDKMGWLEKIIVTPSHHRVHHAINPQYIDKNYGQILIIWDKMFGSFQPELDSVEPVYGILRPVKTWNPVIINYKHLWQLIQDAFFAERIWDKIRIWFMPTGWRPEDVAIKYPIYTIEDPSRQEKYDTNISTPFIIWSFIQLNIAVTLMFHFFTVIPQQTMAMNYCYAALLMVHIFSFTSAMDRKRYSIGVEFLKMLMGFSLLYRQNFFWFGLDGVYIYSLMIYLIISVIMTWYFLQEYKMNSAHP